MILLCPKFYIEIIIESVDGFIKNKQNKTNLDLKQKEKMSCTHMDVMGKVQHKMHRQHHRWSDKMAWNSRNGLNSP